MIQASELRRGNLLNRNGKLVHPQTTLPDELVEVFLVLENKIAYVYPNIENRVEPFEDDVAQFGKGFLLLDEVEPVPLSEKILVNTGCVVNGQSVQLAYSNNEYIQFKWDGKQLEYIPAIPTGSPVMVTALHQLQNLYADLTGHELDIITNLNNADSN